MNTPSIRTIVFSVDFSLVAVVKASSGELKDKITFPEGVGLPTEPTHFSLPCTAASRIFFKATGLNVPLESWYFASNNSSTSINNKTLWGRLPFETLAAAKGRPESKLEILPVAELLTSAWANPELFDPDFLGHLAAARNYAATRKV